MLTALTKDYTRATEQIGLTTNEASNILAKNGKNALAAPKKANPIWIFLGQFRDVMVIILLISTAISVVLGEIYDAITIILIVLLNAILGFIQEYRTEKTLAALNKMTAPTARCYRDGVLTTINAEDIVIGDIIEVEAGDRVPADCCIFFARGLFSDESMLTGESIQVEKSSGLTDNTNALGKKNILYSGTIVIKGHGQAKVIATGINSQMGKISGMLVDINDEQTPLQKRLAELGKVVAIICIVVCVIVFVAGVLRGEAVFAMLLTGISIAIAAIPEGLPATVTIALALAVSRMLKEKALVHRLYAVETLGCTSVICSDKTGTITENRMTVTKIYTNSIIYNILGSGYKISGELQLNGRRINPIQTPSLKEILIAATLCNNGKISTDKNLFSRDRGKLSVSGEWEILGDPTEICLLVAAAKGGILSESLKSDYKKLDEIPFDSISRSMTVIVKEKNGDKTAYMKGALDVILRKCDFTMSDTGIISMSNVMKKKIISVNDKLSDDALRVLAFAKRDVTTADSIDSGYIFLGLMGMMDPPRPEAKRAIRICEKAHIKTVMITGDHKNTAVAIAKQAGILRGDFDHCKKVLTGSELAKISDEELLSKIEDISVFARVDPADKLRIVRAFKSRGHIVTMTGDGVNDAPAIKEASIGVSMGITGTDVTKQAADVILLDDNFATLVNAVKQGRTIYSNIRKFVRYLLSCNIGEVITMFLGILMGLPLVMLPTQILLVNLITDGLPAIALGVEPVEEGVMLQKPRLPGESFFSNGLMSKIIFRGILIGLSTLGCFVAILNLTGNVDIARTAGLFTLVISQLIHVFECKSEHKNVFTVPYFNNVKLLLAVIFSGIVIFAAIYFPPLQLVFNTIPLTVKQLLIALGFSFAIPIIASLIPKKSC